MNDFINNEYVHIGISLLCIAWASWNIKQKKLGKEKGKSKTFQAMDNVYSYALIVAGCLIIIWSIANIAQSGQ